MTSENDKVEGRPAAVQPSRPRWLRMATGWAPVLVFSALVIAAAVVGGNLLQSRPSSPPPLGTSNISRAPDFQIIAYQEEDLLGGEEIKFSDLLSQGKPVVLNFWAGQCPPCRVEMPDLQEVHEEYGDRVLLFGLDVGPFVGLGSREDGHALLQELNVTYPNGTTFDAEVVRRYRVLGMPSTYFIKPNGEVVAAWTGLLTRDKLVELVEEMLSKS